MDTTPPEKRVQDAYDAIGAAEAEAKRLVNEARLNFGAVVNEVTASKEMEQNDVVRLTGKTREWVRQWQRKAAARK